MMSKLETGPQYPAEEGSKISGDPAVEVDGQGLFSSPTTGPSNAVVSKQATVVDCATASESNSRKGAVKPNKFNRWLKHFTDRIYFKNDGTEFIPEELQILQRNGYLLTVSQRSQLAKKLKGVTQITKKQKRKLGFGAKRINETRKMNSLEQNKSEPMQVDNNNEVEPKIGMNNDDAMLTAKQTKINEKNIIEPPNLPTRSFYSNNWHSYLNKKNLSHFIEPPPNSETGPVYENKVDGNLKVYIVDQSQPDGRILDRNRSTLELALTKSIDETLDSGYLTPKFLWFAYSKEKFYISCQNLESLNFLKTAVKRFGELWPDAQLRVVDNTRTIEATVWIPGQIEDPEILIRRIGRQNNLNFMKWQLLDVELKPGFGQILSIAIDDESSELLRKTYGMVSCGLTTVTMKMKFLNGDNVEFDDTMGKGGELLSA